MKKNLRCQITDALGLDFDKTTDEALVAAIEAASDPLPLDEWLAWDRSTFTDSTARTCLVHLGREVEEALAAVDGLADAPAHPTLIRRAENEVVDVLVLAYQAARFVSGGKLGAAMSRKLKENRGRTWGKPDEEGVCEHVRDDLAPKLRTGAQAPLIDRARALLPGFSQIIDEIFADGADDSDFVRICALAYHVLDRERVPCSVVEDARITMRRRGPREVFFEEDGERVSFWFLSDGAEAGPCDFVPGRVAVVLPDRPLFESDFSSETFKKKLDAIVLDGAKRIAGFQRGPKTFEGRRPSPEETAARLEDIDREASAQIEARADALALDRAKGVASTPLDQPTGEPCDRPSLRARVEKAFDWDVGEVWDAAAADSDFVKAVADAVGLAVETFGALGACDLKVRPLHGPGASVVFRFDEKGKEIELKGPHACPEDKVRGFSGEDKETARKLLSIIGDEAMTEAMTESERLFYAMCSDLEAGEGTAALQARAFLEVRRLRMGGGS